MVGRAPRLSIALVVASLGCSSPERGAPPPQPAATAPDPAAVASAVPALATSTATTAPTGTAPAPMPPSPASPSARPPAAPATAILRGATAVEPGSRVTLAPGAETVVHPEATFEVELSARASDARLVLVDARDDLVAASATREVGAGTRLTLAPAAPLVPGSRYVLRLDGAAGRELHDEAGRAFSAVTLPLLAAGSPPPAEPRPARKKRRP